MKTGNAHGRERTNHCELCIVHCALILIVEDNIQLNEVNRRAMELQGYSVLSALNLAQASAHLQTAEPDVILLDVMLPDGDGMDFAADITSSGAYGGQIVFLTAKTADEDRYRGLGVGDDYITKPFAPAELTARVQAALTRRARQRRQKNALQKGALRMDMLSGQAFLRGEDLHLTQKEFAVLLLLAQNTGATVSAATLYESVWKAPLSDDSQSLRTVVSRLRRKLGGGFAVETVYSDGYRFTMHNS
jgi:DNA-binding response OmpR family regulator